MSPVTRPTAVLDDLSVMDRQQPLIEHDETITCVLSELALRILLNVLADNHTDRYSTRTEHIYIAALAHVHIMKKALLLFNHMHRQKRQRLLSAMCLFAEGRAFTQWVKK